MKRLAAACVISLALGAGDPVLAQRVDGSQLTWPTTQREERLRGNGLDILSGLSSEYRRLHGHRVHRRGATMIVLADDGTTASVDVSAIGAEDFIELGKAITLAVKPGHEPNSFIARRIQSDPPDPMTGKISRRPFDSIQGSIEGVEGATILFRTSEGMLLRADATGMPGRTAIRVNDRGFLTYERGPTRRATALWLERQEIEPSAAVGPRRW